MRIRFLFTTSKGLISKAINWFTWGEYSHVAILISDKEVIESRAFFGVRQTTLRDVLRYNSKVYAYDLELDTINSSKAITALRLQVGKKYDYAAIGGFLARKEWGDKDRWVCSELAAWLLIQLGYKRKIGPLHKVSPEKLKQILEGSLNLEGRQLK